MEWCVQDAKSGVPTLRVSKNLKQVYIHSKYDPLAEARKWVAANGSERSNGEIVILGLGLGYHAEIMAQQYPQRKIIVWEFNEKYIQWLEQKCLLDRLRRLSNVKLKVSDQIEVIKAQLLPIIDEEGIEVLVYFPALELIPEELRPLREAIDKLVLSMRTMRRFGALLDDNFSINQQLQDPHIGAWLNKYADTPMILVSAGPSLTKQLALLKELGDDSKVVIGCVGTALKPLLTAGIIPSFVMISDPQDNIVDQFTGINVLEIPLFYLATANAKAVANFVGQRYVVWQKGYPFAEEQALAHGIHALETGGSVATCLLDLMVLMGGNPIALVGQDLAYTDGQSHAVGTHLNRETLINYNYVQVTSWDGCGMVPTSKNLQAYLHWFKLYVADKPQGQFWNCTEGGAYIEGFLHAPLVEFVERFIKNH